MVPFVVIGALRRFMCDYFWISMLSTVTQIPFYMHWWFNLCIFLIWMSRKIYDLTVWDLRQNKAWWTASSPRILRINNLKNYFILWHLYYGFYIVVLQGEQHSVLLVILSGKRTKYSRIVFAIILHVIYVFFEPFVLTRRYTCNATWKKSRRF